MKNTTLLLCLIIINPSQAGSDLVLNSDARTVTNQLHIGCTSQSFIHQAIINLTGSNSAGSAFSRDLIVNNGVIESHGKTPQSAWIKINQHIQTNDNEIQILEATSWQSSNQINPNNPMDIYYESVYSMSFTL